MTGSQAARPGVWAPEEFFDVEPYVAELRKRDFQVDFTVKKKKRHRPA